MKTTIFYTTDSMSPGEQCQLEVPTMEYEKMKMRLSLAGEKNLDEQTARKFLVITFGEALYTITKVESDSPLAVSLATDLLFELRNDSKYKRMIEDAIENASYDEDEDGGHKGLRINEDSLREATDEFLNNRLANDLFQQVLEEARETLRQAEENAEANYQTGADFRRDSI